MTIICRQRSKKYRLKLQYALRTFWESNQYSTRDSKKLEIRINQDKWQWTSNTYYYHKTQKELRTADHLSVEFAVRYVIVCRKWILIIVGWFTSTYIILTSNVYNIDLYRWKIFIHDPPNLPAHNII